MAHSRVHSPDGKPLVALGVNDSGGLVTVVNKTGYVIAGMVADDNGNGVVMVSSRMDSRD